MRVGYARVSADDQNLARQLNAFEEAGVEKVFQEKVSGKNTKDRTAFLEMMQYIRDKDIVTVLDMDRLGRNSKEITESVAYIQQKGAALDVLSLPSFAEVKDENLRRLLTNMVFEIYKYQAEAERKDILRRQEQGIRLAKERGVYKGGERQYSPTGSKRYLYKGVVKQLVEGVTIAQISRNTGVGKTQVRRIREYATQIGDLSDKGANNNGQ